MTIEVPPLRAYKADNLGVLAPLFVQLAAQRHEKRTPRITPEALAALHAYDYPGNVRELKNALEHAVIMASHDTIDVGELPRTMRPGGSTFPPPPSAAAMLRASRDRGSADARSPAPLPDLDRPLAELRDAWLSPLERRYLEALLAECRGNVRRAARRAGVDAVTFYRLLKKRGLRVDRTVAPR
jgi:two-component system, NtrC family, response regulator AtoC